MNLKDAIIVVTGASSGLGKAVTELLAEEGARVFALARSVEHVELPASVVKVSMNIRDLQSIDLAFKQIDQQTQHIDILVNCAGRRLMKPLEQTSREEIMDAFGVNLKGNIYIAQEVYRRMLPRQSGHIINVSSTSGLKGRPDESIYCATKWGLRGFTESLRLEAAPHKIRVSGVYPGGMKTNFWSEATPRDPATFMDPKDIARQIIVMVQTPASLSPSEYVIERGVDFSTK